MHDDRPQPYKLSNAMLSLASRLAPDLFASLLAKRFLTPPQTPVRATAELVLSSARRRALTFREQTIVTYSWYAGENEALLVHGWGGSAGDMTSLVAPLLARGWTVHAFDAPAHGASTGTRTNASEMADLLGFIADGSEGIDAIVTHSLGASVAALAMARGVRASRLVTLAPAPALLRDRKVMAAAAAFATADLHHRSSAA